MVIFSMPVFGGQFEKESRTRSRRGIAIVATLAVALSGAVAVAVLPSGSAQALASVPNGCAEAVSGGKPVVRCVFGYTSKQIGGFRNYTVPVPAGVNLMTAYLWGAGGGGVASNYWHGQAGGGAGGFVKGTLDTTELSSLNLIVGQGGKAGPAGREPVWGLGGLGGVSRQNTNKGGAYAGGSSGGGMSAIYSGGNGAMTSTNTIMVAGGGGGASPGADAPSTGDQVFPGNGGGPEGTNDNYPTLSGRAGTATEGGAAATSTTDCMPLPDYPEGRQFFGGDGLSGAVNRYQKQEGGGGGGGGWFGGGGGRCQASPNKNAPTMLSNGGGGGGSSYADPLLVSETDFQSGTNAAYRTEGVPYSGDGAPYETGIGRGGLAHGHTADASGGNGLIVLEWDQSIQYSMSVSKTEALQNDTLTYEVKVKNPSGFDFGGSALAGLSVDVANLITGATVNLGSFTTTKLGWTMKDSGSKLDLAGPLLAGDEATFTFTATVKDVTLASSWSLATSVSGAPGVPNPSCIVDEACETTVKTPRELVLTFPSSQVERGETSSYEGTLYWGNGIADPRPVTGEITIQPASLNAAGGTITPSTIGSFSPQARWRHAGQTYTSAPVTLSVVKSLNDAITEGKSRLDDAASAAKGNIEGLEHLTPEEKSAAKTSIDQTLATAKTAVENATTVAGASDAADSGRDAIQKTLDDAMRADAKAGAVKALEVKAASVKDQVDALKNVSAAQKETARGDVDRVLAEAKGVVNAAGDVAGVDAAVLAGKDAMDAVYTGLAGAGQSNLGGAKGKAKSDLDAAAVAAKDRIEALSGLTGEAKAAAKDAVDAATVAAKDAVDAAATVDDAGVAGSRGQSVISTVVDDAMRADAKAGAVKALEVKAASVKDQVDALKNVSAAQKETARGDVDRVLAEAKGVVNAAGDVAGVDAAVLAGKDAMDAVYTGLAGAGQSNLGGAKGKAKSDLDAAAVAAKDRIEALSGLTGEAKAAAKDAVDAATVAAKDAVDAAATVDDAGVAGSRGQSVISTVVDDAMRADAKAGAVKALEVKAASVKDQVDALKNVSAAQKETARGDVDRVLAEAKGVVNAAGDVAGVDAAVLAGKDAMDAVYTGLAGAGQSNLGGAKGKAKSDLDAAAVAAKDRIEALSGLTGEAKAAAKDAVDAATVAAKDAVDAAATVDDAGVAGSRGQSVISTVVDDAMRADAKAGAVKALEVKAASVKDQVDALKNVSAAQKETARGDVDRVLAEAKGVVNAAGDVAGVDAAVLAGKDAMDAVYTGLAGAGQSNLGGAKGKAKSDLDAAAVAAKDRIEALSGLTGEAKAAAKDAVDAATVAAKDAVDAAATVDDAGVAGSRGQSVISTVVDDAMRADAKAGAVKALEVKAASVKDQIDALKNVSAAQKETARGDVDRVLADAKGVVNAAGDVAGVDAAVLAGKDAMDTVYTGLAGAGQSNLGGAKGKAKSDLDAAAVAAKDRIETLSGLTGEAKAAAKDAVDAATVAAKDAVDAAATVDDAGVAGSRGQSAISTVVDDAMRADAKAGAVKALEVKAASVKDQVDALKNVSAAQKETARGDVDRVLAEAKGVVNAAGDVAGVDAAVLAGKDAMDAVYTGLAGAGQSNLGGAKGKAKSDLDAAAVAAKDRIEALSGLTGEAKAAAKDAVDAATVAAKDAVDAAATVDDAGVAGSRGQSAISTVVDDAMRADAKAGAVKALEVKAASVKDQVDALKNVSAAQKETARGDVDRVLAEAKGVVNAAGDVAGVDAAVLAGKDAMDAVYTGLAGAGQSNLGGAKGKAKSDLDAAAVAAKDRIETLSGLTGEAKAAAKDAVDAATVAAKDAVDAAATVDDAGVAGSRGQSAISTVVDDAMRADAKAGAVKALEVKAASVKDQVDALKNVSAAQKETARGDVDRVLAEAKGVVNAAGDVAGVDAAVLAGKDAMDTVYTGLAGAGQSNLGGAKGKAKSDLDAAAVAAKDRIETLSGLTGEAKAAAKDAVDAATVAAKDAVDAAATVDDAGVAGSRGQSAISTVVDDAMRADAKAGAVKALEVKAASVKDQVDALKNVSAAQKETARGDVDRVLAEAKGVVNAAGDVAGVDAAVLAGKDAMDTVYTGLAGAGQSNLGGAKGKAKSDLDAAAVAAKDRIETLSGLTGEAKAAAKDAVDAATVAAKDAVDAAATVDDAGVAGSRGQSAISTVVDDAMRADAKAGAVKALEVKAASVKDQVDALKNVSAAQKETARGDVDRVLAEAKGVVNAAGDVAGVDAAVLAGKDAMDTVYTGLAGAGQSNLGGAKGKAKSDLDAAAVAAKDRIETLSGLTGEAKAAAKDAVDAATVAAKDAVDAAATVDDAGVAGSRGQSVISTVVDDAMRADAKAGAVKALEVKAASVKDQVDALKNVSAAQKETARGDVDRVLAEAKGVVNAAGDAVNDAVNDAASDVAGVGSALEAGKNAIDAIYNSLAGKDTANLDKVKEKAKSDLDAAASRAKDTIEGMPDLTADEKAAAKAAIDRAVSDAKAVVDNSPDAEAASGASSAGESSIQKTLEGATLTNAKHAAIKELEARAASVKKAIDALVDVSAGEKVAAKAAVDAELAHAKTAVDSATTVADVKSGVGTGKTKMDDIYVALASEGQTNLGSAKDKAKSDLETAARDAKSVIDALPNLSSAEKATAKAEIDEALAKAKAAVDSATTVEKLDEELKAGGGAILKTLNGSKLADGKLAAIKDLQAKADAVKASIDAKPNVSAADKAAAKKAVDAELAAAIARINSVTAVARIAPAVKSSKATMDGIYKGLIANIEETKTQKPAKHAKPSSGLVKTGGDVEPAMALGLLTLLAGAALWAAGRRNRAKSK